MADAIVKLVDDTANSGKKVDTSELTVGSNTVERQRINLADPVTAAAIASLAQFHSADNAALGTFYGLVAGAIGQVLNVAGNLDRVRGMGGDSLPGTGIPLSLGMLATIGTATAASTSPTAGTNKTISVPSTTGIIAGSVVQIEDAGAATVEWAVVTSLVANTSITVANLASAHTTPNVYPISFNMPRDVNGAGLAPVQGAATAFGIQAAAHYGIFRAYASLPALTDKKMTPLQMDATGTLKVGSVPLGTPIYGSSNGGAAANNVTLTIPAAKMGYLDGFDIDGLGATAGSAIAVTVTGLLGGTLTFSVPVIAGATTPNPTFSKRFSPPLQASAVNTNIVVNVPSFGTGNTAASCNAYGRYL